MKIKSITIFAVWIFALLLVPIVSADLNYTTLNSVFSNFSVCYNSEGFFRNISDTIIGNINGTIDDVMIFNRSLSSDEILSIYNATKYQHTQNNLSEGAHTFKAYTQDLAGNMNNSGVIYFTTDTTPPVISFISQNPADINTFNIFNQFLNITYNITDVVGVNHSTIKLYYKSNSSSSNNFFYSNGTTYSGYQTGAETIVNNSVNYTFSINDNEVYPASYNFDETAMRNTTHLIYDLDANNEYIKIRLFNISNLKNYSFFELFIQNQTAISNSLRIYYCNSSYSTGNPINNANCINFYNILASTPANHSHGVTSHYVVPVPINTTNKMLGDIYVTNTSYFLLRGRQGTNAWNVYYISNVSRTDTIQTTTTGGTSWTNLSGTVDAHMHQYDGSETFYYYMCANDTLGNSNCSSIRSDLLDLTGLPPSSPEVYSPIESVYSGNININYTASQSPNAYAISFYNISLVYENETYVSSIKSNNSLNLSYVWNSVGTNGEYRIRVEACDNQNQCSFGFSENFTIDNTPPYFINITNTTLYDNESLSVQWNASDNILFDSFKINWTNTFSITKLGLLTNISGLSAGIYYINVTINDSANNLNSSVIWVNVTALITDNSYPIFSNFNVSIANNTQYNPTNIYQFNTTIINTNGTAGIEFNGTNYTLSNVSSIFNYTFNSLSAGTYSYYFYAYGNGTNHLFNNTQTYYYTIAKHTGALTFKLNSIANDISITYPTPVNASAYSSSGQTILILRDSVDITTENNVFITLGANSTPYDYWGIAQENENYSILGLGRYLTVNQNSSFLSLTSSSGWNILASTYSTIQGICPTELTCNLYQSGTGVSNPFTNIFPAGLYQFTFNTTGNANYSSSSVSNTLNSQVNQTNINGTLTNIITTPSCVKHFSYNNPCKYGWINNPCCYK